jgi:FkbM family methyltransferase
VTKPQPQVDWSGLPVPRPLDPLYFDRRKSLESALFRNGNRKIQTVIDVGANEGQSARQFLEWFPECEIVCFEPVKAPFLALETLSRDFPMRKVYVRNVALSDEISGSRLINTSERNTKVSSFKAFNYQSITAGNHRGLSATSPSIFEAPEDFGLSYEEVTVTTLDAHFHNSDHEESNWIVDFEAYPRGIDLLKIDTQGWDYQVMRGALTVLDLIDVVIFEWQFDDIYGTPTPLHLADQLLCSKGLRLWDISHIYKCLNPLRSLWVDLIYVRQA